MDFSENILVLLCQRFNEMRIGKNIGHCFGNHLSARLIVIHLWILFAYLLDQSVYVLTLRLKLCEYRFSEFIIPYGIPLFNELHEIMGKRAKHGIFCKIVHGFDFCESVIDINIDFVPRALEIVACLGIVNNDINARCFSKGRKDSIYRILRIVKGLFEISNGNALTLDLSFFTLERIVFRRFIFFVYRIFLVGDHISRRLSRLISKLSLSIGEICGRTAFHGVGKSNAALTHIVGHLISPAVFLHVLTFVINVYESTCLRAVFFAFLLKSALRSRCRRFCGGGIAFKSAVRAYSPRIFHSCGRFRSILPKRRYRFRLSECFFR